MTVRKKTKLKRFLVKAEYGCQVETTVVATDKTEAEQLAEPELDETASRNLMCQSLKVEEIGNE